MKHRDIAFSLPSSLAHIQILRAATESLLGGGTKVGRGEQGISTFPTLAELLLLLQRFSIVLSTSLRMIILLSCLTLMCHKSIFLKQEGGKGKEWVMKKVFVPFWLAALWGPANSPCLAPSISQ